MSITLICSYAKIWSSNKACQNQSKYGSAIEWNENEKKGKISKNGQIADLKFI